MNRVKAELFFQKTVIENKIPNIKYNKKENELFRLLENEVKTWSNQINKKSKSKIYIRVVKSGSRAKGDAIKGHSDLDLLVSITDKKKEHEIDYYYDSLGKFLDKRHDNVRRLRVALNFKLEGFAVDMTPAMKIVHNITKKPVKIDDIGEHYIYEHLPDGSTKILRTNVHRQIIKLRRSPYKDVIVLLKMWRNLHKEVFYLSSYAIEIITMKVLNKKPPLPLLKNLEIMFKFFIEKIEIATIADPDNRVSNVTDRVFVKPEIVKQAKHDLPLLATHPDKVIHKDL